jgi:aldose 1-epimerase
VRQSEPIEQLSLSRVSENGTSIAVISPLGGAIRQLLINDFEIVPEFSLADPLKYIYGHTLAPWPNRLQDASYEFGGEQLRFDDLDAQNNKNHGLLLSEVFEVRAHSNEQLVLGYRFGGHEGYPFEIDLEVSFALKESTLEVEAKATNHGDPAPFAIGFHPYLLTGQEFELNANVTGRSIQNERMLPIGVEPIDSLTLTQYSEELSSLDHCFVGGSRVTLTRPDGAVVVEALENLPYFMMYRPSDPLATAGPVIAIEPQSSMANVFRDDVDSVLLERAETKRYRFAIRKL